MGLEELRRKMAVLGRQYALTLPEHVAAVRDLAASARTAGGADGTLEALRARVHRLKGTAGTMGFADTTAAAERLEHRVVAFAEAVPVGADDPRWAGVEESLRGLEDLAAAACSEAAAAVAREER